MSKLAERPVLSPPASLARHQARILTGVAWLALAWLIPLGTHLVKADWLLPPLVLLVTAGLLRAGRSLLDRLILAIGFLLGALALAGLLFSVWPFGFQPVAVAGTALTVLGAISLGLGRRPALPRPSLKDLVATGGAAATLVYFAMPLLTTDGIGRFAMVRGGGEDNTRHFQMYDTARRVGGYLFFHDPAGMPDLWPALRFYPHGWHLTAGVLDGFVRSSATALGDSVSAWEHYAWFIVAGYAVFALVLFWAIGWVGGPLLTWSRLMPIVAVAAVPVFQAEFAGMVVLGHVAEILGLSFLSLILALVIRPAARTREQLFLLAFSLVGLGFCYYLFLPAAGLMVLIWLIRARREVLRHRVALGAAFAVTLASPLAGLLAFLSGTQDEQIVAEGLLAKTSRSLLLAVMCLVIIGLASRAGRKLRVWHAYRYPLVITVLFAGAVGGYQIMKIGATSYYYEKALHAVTIVALLGLGCLALLIPRRTKGSVTRAVAATAIVIAGFGLIGDGPYRTDKQIDTRDWGDYWFSRDADRIAVARPEIEYLLKVDQAFPAEPGTATVMLADEDWRTHTQTMFLAAIQRTSADTAQILYARDGLIVAGNGEEALVPMFARAARPVHVIATTPKAMDKIEAIRRAHPELPLTADLMPYAPSNGAQ